MKSLVFFCFLGFLLLSCGSKDVDHTPVPPNVLNQIDFAKLLVKFSLAESASNLNIKSAQPGKTDSVYAFDPLLENNVRKSQYDSTLLFYSTHPILYRAVYDTVLARLNALRVSREQLSSPVH